MNRDLQNIDNQDPFMDNYKSNENQGNIKFAGLMPDNKTMDLMRDNRFGDELEIEDVNIDLGDDHEFNKRERVISLDSDEQ